MYKLIKNLSFEFITSHNEVVAKVMFLQVCVCPQGGRVSASVHAGMPYPRMENPPGWRIPPGWRNPPLEADSSIRSTSSRYASYWNAFLFYIKTVCSISMDNELRLQTHPFCCTRVWHRSHCKVKKNVKKNTGDKSTIIIYHYNILHAPSP